MVVKNMKEMAKALDEQRTVKNLSKNRLAKESDMSRPTLLNIIQKGTVRNGFYVESLFKIAKALDLEIIIRPI